MKSNHMIVTILMSLVWVSLASATTVQLQWDPNTESDLAGYKVYYKADSSALPFDGTGAAEGSAPVDVHNTTTATISGLDPSRAYNFAITAYNTAGVESSYSNIVSIPESLAPTTSITFPAGNSSVSGTVSVTASASDNAGVSRVEFYLDNVLQATDTTSTYLYSWNTATATPGSHTLIAKAYDAAGNVGVSSAVTVQVVNDTTAPTASINSPAANATISGTVNVSATATDNVGISRVEFFRNNIMQAAVNTAPYSYNWNTTAASNGSYSMYVRAYDAAGNSVQSPTVAVTVNNLVSDTTAPAISTFTMPTAAASLTVSVSLSASDATGVTGYLITESATAPAAGATGWSATAPATFTFSAAGSRTAYAWAKDAAGNVSVSLNRTVVITLPDTTAPAISTFTMPTAASSLTVSVNLSASDATGVTGYLITESATAPAAGASGWSATAPATFTFSAAGSRTAYAWAKDAAGNVSASLNRTVVITLPDTTAPVVSFNQVASPTPATSQALSGAVSDNVGVASVTVQVGSAIPYAATVSGNSWSFNLTGLPVGTSTITVRASDAAGNSATTTASIVVEAAAAPLTIADATLAMQVSVGRIKPSNDQKTRLDVAPVVNGKSSPNGKVDTGDAIVILFKVVGKIAL